MQVILAIIILLLLFTNSHAFRSCAARFARGKKKYTKFIQCLTTIQNIIEPNKSLNKVIDSSIISSITDLFNNYLTDNDNENIPKYIQVSFRKYIKGITYIRMYMDDINKYILCSSSLSFISDDKQIKYHLINQIFDNLEEIEIKNMSSINYSSLLSEIKQINESKLKFIEIRYEIIDSDSFNKYVIEFKDNKWNIEYKRNLFGKHIMLHRF